MQHFLYEIGTDVSSILPKDTWVCGRGRLGLEPEDDLLYLLSHSHTDVCSKSFNEGSGPVCPHLSDDGGDDDDSGADDGDEGGDDDLHRLTLVEG